MRSAARRANIGSVLCYPPLQATKEAEYREKVADLKMRIDSGKEHAAAEDSQNRAAKVRNILSCIEPTFKHQFLVAE